MTVRVKGERGTAKPTSLLKAVDAFGDWNPQSVEMGQKWDNIWTAFQSPIKMIPPNKSFGIPEFRNNQQSGFTKKF
jgi:hypothetical protein